MKADAEGHSAEVPARRGADFLPVRDARGHGDRVARWLAGAAFLLAGLLGWAASLAKSSSLSAGQVLLGALGVAGATWAALILAGRLVLRFLARRAEAPLLDD